MKRLTRQPLRGIGTGLFVLACVLSPRASRADQLSSAIYVRSDSDDTTVVAPRLHAQLPLEEATNLNFTYAVDVWTSASIDIMTSASKVPVTEQRDEIDVAVDHAFDDITLSGSYRYSTEPDYLSNGGSLGLSYDFAENNATFGAGLSASSDSVGKAGDPNFDEAVGTVGGRVSFSQILSTNTVAQLIYELSHAQGYLASPYRYVAIGGPGRCTAPAGLQGTTDSLCVPEAAPDERLRHALALELRQALGQNLSLGVGYRFYLDDWKLQSHTVRLELGWLLDTETQLALRYRFYTQNAAEQYRAVYLVPQPYVTTDKELSPLSSHRFALELDHDWSFGGDRSLRAIVSFAPIFYSFSDFPPLKKITAYELNATVVLTP